MINKKITITELSKLVGVSKATISHYLNGNYKTMSESTRLRIEAAIQETDYQPSYHARNLKNKKSKTIAIIFSHLNGADISVYLQGIYDECRRADCTTVLYNTYNDPQTERKYLQACWSQQVDGIIWRACSSDNFGLAHKLCQQGTPIVLMDRCSDSWEYDSVYIDQRSIVNDALEHMWMSGYQTIHFFSTPYTELDSKRDRLDAFAAFVNRRLHDDPQTYLHIIDEQHLDDLSQILYDIHSDPGNRKGIFIGGGSRLIWKTLYELRAQSINMPQDMRLCVVDSYWEWCKLISPGITAIYQPCHELGLAASQILLQRIDAPDSSEKKRQILQARLTINKSTSYLEPY